MIIEWVIALSILFGSGIGYVAGNNQVNKNKLVEPELWSPEQHKKMLRECATQCKRSGTKFRSYTPQTGDCACFLRRK